MEIDDQKKKSVNNYQQLPTICERLFKGSTIQRSRSCPLGLRISHNWQQLFWGGQQLATIGIKYFWGGQQLSTITNNLQEVWWSTIINNYQQLF